MPITTPKLKQGEPGAFLKPMPKVLARSRCAPATCRPDAYEDNIILPNDLGEKLPAPRGLGMNPFKHVTDC
jgi:hypothetical protein